MQISLYGFVLALQQIKVSESETVGKAASHLFLKYIYN
jgi:hypothetical protein